MSPEEERQSKLDLAVFEYYRDAEGWHLEDYILLAVHSSASEPGVTQYTRAYLGNNMQPHKILGLLDVSRLAVVEDLDS